MFYKLPFILVFCAFSLFANEKDPQLFVLVSFSMPQKSLQAWAEQVNKVNGELVFRGFHENSIRKTIEKTKLVFGEKTPSIKIDPLLFQKYGVTSVPAVVLGDDHIYGDISLESALQKMRSV